MLRQRLFLLYPRAWRERYGEEFLATVEHSSLHVQQVIDMIAGAIDAWLSADVRRVTMAARVGASEGGRMSLKSLTICERTQGGVTIRDGLMGAAVMLGTSWLLKGLAVTATHQGLPVVSDVLMSFAFIGPFTLSMPFWLMKGQPWKAQVVIIGGTFALLVLIGCYS